MTVLALLMTLPLAQATPVSPLTPGTRVRVTVREASGERTVTGPLRTFDSQALTLTSNGARHVSLPRSTITKIEVSRGHRRRVGEGALVGAVAGLAVFALIEASCTGECEPAENRAALAAGAVAVGAVAGAGVGALARSERWEPVPWAVSGPRSTRLRPALSLSLRF